MAEVNATLSSMDQDTEIVHSREDLVAGVAEIGGMSHDIATVKYRESIDRHVQRCKILIEDLKKTFKSEPSLRDHPRILAWIKGLEEVEKKLQFPKTIIAVVGDSGVGKSSLMNAILNYRNVLPTSGIRACTAVVVEVSQNTNNTNFEADIEFLDREEWLEELKVLTQDLEAETENKKKTKRKPDPTSEVYVSYCKLKAVYGRIGTFDELSRIDSTDAVTSHLGETLDVSSKTQEEFRGKIGRYIKPQETASGGQFWPIVKHVRLRMPHCDVCSSGAVLVDLPGIRDSNAARDKIASEYLKNCTAVWIVSSIHRAIDDKTAKDLLGDRFKRQLLMDGLYGSIAFICTKTDHLEPSEIISLLGLKKQTNPHQVKVAKMTATKSKLEKIEQPLSDLAMSKRKQKILQLEKDIGIEQRTIKAICAKARNEYCKREIRRNFKEIKRRDGMTNEEGEEEEEEDLLYDDDEEDEAIGCSDRNLRVFCCSSTEYQKLKTVLTEDGPAQVFYKTEDTDIPDVRRYVHEITSVRRQQALETLIHGLGRFVFDIQTYIEGDFQGQHNQSDAESLINSHLTEFGKITETIQDTLSNKIDDEFENGIFPKLQQGATIARDKASEICAKWGAPIKSDRTGGLPWTTYSSATRHHGMLQSRIYGLVDFNEDLSEPMLAELKAVWDETFSRTLYQILDDARQEVWQQLLTLTNDLCCCLDNYGVDQEQSGRMCDKFKTTTRYHLNEMVKKLKEEITTNQREISRRVKPHITKAMTPTYDECKSESGSGMFGRIKNKMKTRVDSLRNTMFDEATKSIKDDLDELNKKIIDDVKASCQTVKEKLKTAFEPLWNDKANMQKIRAALGEPTSCRSINIICSQMRQLYSDAGLTNLEHQTEDLHPGHLSQQ